MPLANRKLGGVAVLMLACVTAAVVSCHDQLPSGPKVLDPPPIEFSQGSPDVPVQGCAKWTVTLTGGSGITTAVASHPSCGPIVPALTSAATYDPVTKTISLPIAISNTWTREVVSPARVYAWNDSLVITTPTGLTNGTSGTYIRLTAMDSTIGSSAATFKNARLWRYDAILAPAGQPQTLLPSGGSTTRAIQMQVVSGSPMVFTVVLRVQAQNAHPVAMIPLLGKPPGTFADTNLILDAANFGPAKVVKNMVDLMFVRTATQAQRQAAIDSVLGVVVGGLKITSNGDGFYLVRLPTSTGAGLAAALIKLRSLTQVRVAEPIQFSGGNLGRIPKDGAGWQNGNYSYSALDRSGSTWALKAIRAPLAWGCDTGSSTNTKISFADDEFYSLPAEISAWYATGVDLWSGNFQNDAHGTRTSSIAAALGDNSTLMTGVAWRSHLGLYDILFDDDTTLTINHPARRIASVVAHAARDGAVAINVSMGIRWMQDIGHLPVAGSSDEKVVEVWANELSAVLEALAADNPKRAPLIVVAAANDAVDARWGGFASVKDSRYVATAAVRSRVLVVGRSKKASDTYWSSSNWGSFVDVVAPAENVPSLNGYGFLDELATGTSFAAPFATGVAGLLASFDPRLSGDSIALLIKQGALNGGRAVPDGHGRTQYMLDAYEALKAAGQRKKAPLCGNRTWGIDNVVATLRAGNATEALQTYPTSVGPIEHLQVAHGGHWLELNDPASGTRNRLTFANGTWTSGPGSCTDCADLSGAARSGDATTFGGPVHSHNGDSSISWSIPTRPPLSSLPVNFELDLHVGAGTLALTQQYTEYVLNAAAETFANAPGALAYSPTGDFAIYSKYSYPSAGGWFDTYLYRVSIPGGVTDPNFSIFLPQQDASWLAISEDGTELSIGSTYIGGCGIQYWSLKTMTQFQYPFVIGQDTAGSTTNNAGYPTCFLGGSFAADVVGRSVMTAPGQPSGGPKRRPTPPPFPSKKASRMSLLH